MRELASVLGEDPGNLARELRRLADIGILRATRRGRQLYYEANADCPAYPELRGLVVKMGGVAEALSQALSPFAGRAKVAFIYGSIASGDARPDSDVDLLVIGDIDEMKLHEALTGVEEAIGRTINYTIMTPAECRRGRTRGFLRRVLAKPTITLLGDLNECG